MEAGAAGPVMAKFPSTGGAGKYKVGKRQDQGTIDVFTSCR